MTKALDGVRVLDFGHVQAGPTATQSLAWMGADVIKIEMPGRGDITRGQLQDVKGADSLYFTMLNSNKRSITVNLKAPGGRRIIEDLVRRCDVILENFGPGVLIARDLRGSGFRSLTRASSTPRSKASAPAPMPIAPSGESTPTTKSPRTLPEAIDWSTGTQSSGWTCSSWVS